jgi:hypothetical protein
MVAGRTATRIGPFPAVRRSAAAVQTDLRGSTPEYPPLPARAPGRDITVVELGGWGKFFGIGEMDDLTGTVVVESPAGGVYDGNGSTRIGDVGPVSAQFSALTFEVDLARNTPSRPFVGCGAPLSCVRWKPPPNGLRDEVMGRQ